MKICALEICPIEPVKEHLELFKNQKIDFFYVSYKKEGENAIAFNKNKSWAYNRNSLYNHVKGNYDYYFFIDYDIVLSTKSGKNPIDHILDRLELLKPAMYRPCGFNTQMELEEGLSVGGFINHSVTIMSHEVAEYTFNLPDTHGGFWDAASYLNTIAVPVFENSIFVDYDILAKNTQSSGYIQNRIPFIGKRAMDKLYKITKSFFIQNIPDFDNVNDFRSYYDGRRLKYTLNQENPLQSPPLAKEEMIDINGLKNKLKLKN